MDLTAPRPCAFFSRMAEDLPLDALAPQNIPLTDGQIYNALVQSSGNISAAARSVEITRGAFKSRIDKNPACVALLEDLRESVIDKAESNIFADVEKGDQSASRLVAQTIGKARGWSSGVAGLGKDGAITVEITSFTEKQSG